MSNIVTQRFINCHNKLIADNTVRSSRQFAMSLDYLPQSLGEILKGRRDVTIEVLRKAIELYKINPFYIFCGEGSMLHTDGPQNNSGLPITIIDSKDQVEKIVHVPIAAQAGYGGQIHDPIYFNDLKTFSLPDDRYNVGTFRCFDVAGDSMEPTLFEGDKVVCSFIEKDAIANTLRDNYVYVIVTKNDVLVKRIINKIHDSGCIEVFSDNDFYKPYPIPVEDIEEVWFVKVKISPFMPSPSNVRNNFHNEVETLKATIQGQSDVIKELNVTIEKMLKYNRSRMA